MDSVGQGNENMKRLLIAGFCLLVLSACGKSELISGSAKAKWVWVKVAGSVTNEAIIYASLSNISKKGNLVEMWVLFDHNIPDAEKKSIERLDEYDCENKVSRTIYEAGYSENMGKGKAMYVNPDPDKPETVLPGSTNEVLWKTACIKR